MLVLAIINYIFSTLAYNLDLELDILDVRIDDYSVMITNLPLDCKTMEDLTMAITTVSFYYLIISKESYLVKSRFRLKWMTTLGLKRSMGYLHEKSTIAK